DVYYVVPAVGHLFSLVEKEKSGWNYPVFDVEWVPSFEVNKDASFQKPYFQNFVRLSKKAERFVVACDYDTEGSVIGYNILRFICGRSDGERMKFSTLTIPDLKEALQKPMKHLDFPQIEAGLARHILDWLWGINTTRALTLAIKNSTNHFKIISTGRVQGPALKILTDREKEIEEFEPEPYWEVEAHLFKGMEIVALHENGKFWEKEEAFGVKKRCDGKDAKVFEVKRREYKQNPPHPFDLTTLQTEAYAAFRMSPTVTLSIAQSLYERGLISYPRTSSQKLPKKIGYKDIIQKLSLQKKYSGFARKLLSKELKPNEGKKKDPAHPAIYPTGEVPKKLNKYEAKVYDLIVRRFLATFEEPAIRESIKVVFDINGERFLSEGKRTVVKNWMEIYEPYVRYKEQILPNLEKGEVVESRGIEVIEKETQPPPRYTEASIISELEKRNLGTKATRAGIIQTLYDRGYIEGESIRVTDLGRVVVETLEEHCPLIISEEMTRKFEQGMELIERGESKKDDLIERAKKELERILNDFRRNERVIGEKLNEAVIETRRKSDELGVCPECGSNLKIIRLKNGKRFVGCEGYPKCSKSYPLPGTGMIIPLKERCKECGLPMIKVVRKGKRPYTMCIDPNCKSKESWAKRV
ncbi:MAG: DNA topoisomerase I, partial [Candidatus Aenigmatarchaeota archaeon]